MSWTRLDRSMWLYSHDGDEGYVRREAIGWSWFAHGHGDTAEGSGVATRKEAQLTVEWVFEALRNARRARLRAILRRIGSGPLYKTCPWCGAQNTGFCPCDSGGEVM